MLDDIWVVVLMALSFSLGVLARGELARLFKKKAQP
jgi:hypothetical protein